jgi:peptide/nickel transport system permease protein
MISDGIRLIPAAIHLTIVPGVMLVLCVLGINVFGDGLRDALDPRSQVKVHAGGRWRRHRAVVEAATEETS